MAIMCYCLISSKNDLQKMPEAFFLHFLLLFSRLVFPPFLFVLILSLKWVVFKYLLDNM